MTELTMEQQQSAVSLVAKQMTQAKTQAHEIFGMVKAFDFTQKLLTVSTLKLLANIKETKQYKDLDIYDASGNCQHVSTWDEFCNLLGFSRQKIDTDLLNLSDFGETFLETSQRLGLGYRDLRKLRKLPEDALHCRIGSLEISRANAELTTKLHCRIGSLETCRVCQTAIASLHCRIGSLEIGR